MAGPFETQFSIGLKDNFTERYRQIQEEVKRAQQAREQLSMRSGTVIRNEIRQQISAYQDLARSGVVSAEEQGRAYTRLTENVGKLRRELGETERTQHRLIAGLKSGVNLIGGMTAGVMEIMHCILSMQAGHSMHQGSFIAAEVSPQQDKLVVVEILLLVKGFMS
ncbi:hypothetical protein ACWKX9_24245 [Enterobacter asburiae]